MVSIVVDKVLKYYGDTAIFFFWSSWGELNVARAPSSLVFPGAHLLEKDLKRVEPAGYKLIDKYLGLRG
jgi:hypothetical protein